MSKIPFFSWSYAPHGTFKILSGNTPKGDVTKKTPSAGPFLAIQTCFSSFPAESRNHPLPGADLMKVLQPLLDLDLRELLDPPRGKRLAGERGHDRSPHHRVPDLLEAIIGSTKRGKIPGHGPKEGIPRPGRIGD